MRVVLSIHDEKKAKVLISLLQDLSYVDTQVDAGLKKWTGKLSVFDNPIYIEDFKIFAREELYER